MDAIKKELGVSRGCLVFLGVVLLLALSGMVIALSQNALGNLAPAAGGGVFLFGIVIWIGLSKGAGWAKVLAGIIATVFGAGLTLFIGYDFITSLVKGKSILHTEAISAGNYGQSAFIILSIGVAVLAGGVYLLKTAKKS